MILCRDWNGEVHEVPEEELSFRISVYGVIVREGSVLVRPQHGDGYDFPGGGIETGETIEQAFAREVKEETGLTVDMGEILHAGSELYWSIPGKRGYNNILLYYWGESPCGEISTDGFDEHEKSYAKQAIWMPLSQLASVKFHNPIAGGAVVWKVLGRI
jgi:8-oxo-dGTP pyrophosphatase MutT (NUDIX family)